MMIWLWLVSSIGFQMFNLASMGAKVVGRELEGTPSPLNVGQKSWSDDGGAKVESANLDGLKFERRNN